MTRVDKKWPSLADATHLGKRTPRIDGPDKVSGRATYTFDVNRPKLVQAKFAIAKIAHGKVKSIDLTAAKAVKGCVHAEAMVRPGDEVHYHGWPIAFVGAETEEAAREAAHAVKVEWEPLKFNHQARDLDAVDDEWQREARSRKEGDVEAALAGADFVVEWTYGCETITHCCLESHGVVVEYDGTESLTVWSSTQVVSGVAGEAAQVAGLPASKIHVICQHLGGGFGSKFQFDCGPEACRMSRALGRPVKLMLERDMELMHAGSRPSGYARVKVGVKEDGSIDAFDANYWGSNGPDGASNLNLPYVFQGIPNRRSAGTGVRVHMGPDRAWRAPNHPQNCLITMGALDDAAAKLGMDPLEFFRKNLPLTRIPDTYGEELTIAADLIDWKSKWKPRDARTGTLRTGVGVSFHTWQGRGHESNHQVTIRQDGTVETRCGTQDLGVGTRTAIAVVVADALALPIAAIDVKIGDNQYPQSGASGGSTTIGGISSSARTAVIAALNELIGKVAKEIGAPADQIVARGGKLVAAGDPSKAMSWSEACKRIGPQPIVAMGKEDAALMSNEVGGVQMAEVEVDLETGVARMKKMVAVQDCGTIVDLTTAESQVYGGCIMGITSALFEERINDPATGLCLNPDMEFYRLAGIGDVGEIVVHMMQTERHHGRGVIGLGEPPVISPMAAIGNAIANAIGVRVPFAPFTPREILRALGKGGAS